MVSFLFSHFRVFTVSGLSTFHVTFFVEGEIYSILSFFIFMLSLLRCSHRYCLYKQNSSHGKYTSAWTNLRSWRVVEISIDTISFQGVTTYQK